MEIYRESLSHYSLMSLRLCALALGIGVIEGRIVLQGINLVEKPELPDDVQRIQEIADAADKKFYEASDTIIRRLRKRQAKTSFHKRLFEPIDFDDTPTMDPDDSYMS